MTLGVKYEYVLLECCLYPEVERLLLCISIQFILSETTYVCDFML